MSEDIALADASAENKQLAEHRDSNPLTLPAFTPVPRLKDRSNGWKPHVQQRFIAALAETGSVQAACKRLGRGEQGAYRLRLHPQAESFRAAWDQALDLGVRRIEDAAMDRALYGVEEEVIQNGATILKRRRYNEQLVMFILRNRVPDRFTEGGARGLSAMDQARLNQLKAQWRAEWEAEHELEDEEENDSEALMATLETMHRNWFARLGPATRAAYAEFRRRAREDREKDYDWLDAPGHDAEEEDRTIEAQYEEHFGPGQDNRPGIWKVSDAHDVGEADVEEELRRQREAGDDGSAEDAGECDGTQDPPPQGPRIRRITDDGWS